VPSPEASQELYRTLQRLQVVLVLAGRRAWSQMGKDFDRSWSKVAPGLVTVTAAAQLAAATAATEYVPAVLAETGQPDEPEAAVRPRAFAGVASDGRSLAGLLTGAVVAAKTASGRGFAPDAALDVGGRHLGTLLQGAVEDAARDATAAQIIARPNMGWVRQVNPPSCSRCAVLAGRWYSWKADFDRHPGCDCLAIPASENVAGDFTTNPALLVQRGQVTDLTKAQKQRLDEGGDLSKVLNESRDRWRERMAADRRAERRARYTPAEARAADRRAAARVASGEDMRTIHDFMAHLVSRVNAVDGMRAAGIVE
jgi:hypothetical protein